MSAQAALRTVSGSCVPGSTRGFRAGMPRTGLGETGPPCPPEPQVPPPWSLQPVSSSPNSTQPPAVSRGTGPAPQPRPHPSLAFQARPKQPHLGRSPDSRLQAFAHSLPSASRRRQALLVEPSLAQRAAGSQLLTPQAPSVHTPSQGPARLPTCSGTSSSSGHQHTPFPLVILLPRRVPDPQGDRDVPLRQIKLIKLQ